jgi:membrane protease YdiL (CAAX protease family)
VGLLWLGTLLLIRLALVLQQALGLPDVVLAVVPLLFIYAPVVLCHRRGADSWAYRLSIPAFRDLRSWRRALRLAASLAAIILVPWLVGYHFYHAFFPHIVRFGNRLWSAGTLDLALLWPHHLSLWDILQATGPEWSRLSADVDGLSTAGTLVLYQVFFVAIPEEFFYRGYLQTRLNEVHPRKWQVLGVKFGMGALIANLLFAFGHSVVMLQWWHFATFFPGLLFVWLRERSGGVVAGALFHAFCNVSVITLDNLYGIG